jgi:hypothetical protein
MYHGNEKQINYNQAIIKKCGLNSYLDSLADFLQTPVMQVGHPEKAAVNWYFLRQREEGSDCTIE